MKNILISILLLILSSLVVYKYFIEKKEIIDAIDLVPKSAIIIHEVNDPIDKFNQIKNLKNYDSTFLIKKISKQIKYIDSILSNNIEKLSLNNKLITSFHITSKSNFDLIFYLDISIINKNSLMNTFIKNKFTIQNRTFNNYEIFDISFEDKGFSFLFFNNFFIGSYSSVLIEDVIRSINQPGNSFKEAYPKLFKFIKTKDDFGNIYINTNKIDSFLEIFIEENKFSLKDFSNHVDETFLDFSITNNKFFLNGFSLNNSLKKFASLFKNKNIEESNYLNFIPNNCLWLYRIIVEESDKGWEELLINKSDNREKLENYEKKIIENLDNELIIMKLENDLKNQENDIIILKSKDVDNFNKLFIDIESESIKNYVFSLNDKKIYKSNKKFLFKKFLKNKIKIEDDFFFTNINNYIIISNSLININEYLKKVDSQEIWMKSIFYNNLLSNLNNKSNVDLFVNLPKTVIYFLPKIEYNFKNNIIDIFKDFDFLSLQITKLDENFYTSLVLSKAESANEVSKTSSNLIENNRIEIDKKINTKPYLIKSHLDNSTEIIFQDNSNYIYQISSNFQKIWMDSISAKIKSKIYQIDYYKNNKKQIIFSTKNMIHSYDRNGNELIEYPIKNPSNNEIDHFNIIDYNNSKNYRLILSDVKGNVFLKDKTGKTLNGWNPLKFSPLSQSPFHIRILNKDYIIIIEKKGVINVLNRKGKNYPGFPLNFDTNIDSNIFIEKKSTPKKSLITVLLANGKIIKVNMNGVVVEETQLYRPSINSKFDLLIDPTKKNYKIVVTDETTVYVIEKNEVQFKYDLFETKGLNYQYYYFGGNNEMLSILNKSKNNITIFNLKTNSISKINIPSDQLISILYYDYKKEFEIYSILNNKLLKNRLKN